MSRRLRQRLDRIQASSASTTLSPAAVDMLVACYGRLHSLFMPSRSHLASWPAVRRLRHDYLAGVAGISARSAGQKDWVAGHDTRRELEALGLATAVRGAVETTGLILTPAGRSTAFSLVEQVVPGCHFAAWFVERLRGLPADRDRDGEQWVSESSLFGIACTGSCDQWQDQTDAMLEPCVSGSVDSLADCHGRAFYRFVSDFEPLPVVEHIMPNDRAEDQYVQAFRSEIGRLRKLEAADGEICCPLSVTR